MKEMDEVSGADADRPRRDQRTVALQPVCQASANNRPLTGLSLMEAWQHGPWVWSSEAPAAARLNRSVLKTAEREKADRENRDSKIEWGEREIGRLRPEFKRAG